MLYIGAVSGISARGLYEIEGRALFDRATSVPGAALYERIDLSWMVASGHDAVAFRQERRRIVKKWSELIALEEEQEITRIESDLWKKDDAILWENVDDVLQHDLKHLGFLLDVKHMIETMDTNGYTCLEHLRQVSLNNGAEQRPIEELNRVFPPGYPLVKIFFTGY